MNKTETVAIADADADESSDRKQLLNWLGEHAPEWVYRLAVVVLHRGAARDRLSPEVPR
jgi:hypothetical protein